jgi:hypothetical protein
MLTFTNLMITGFAVVAAAIASIASTIHRDRARQAVHDAAFDRWVAARGHEAALHEGSATVVVIGAAPLPTPAVADRALSDGGDQ